MLVSEYNHKIIVNNVQSIPGSVPDGGMPITDKMI